MLSHALDWPSLTVQWMPDAKLSEKKDYQTQRLVLGTHTSEGEQNYLMLAEVKVWEEGEVAAQADVCCADAGGGCDV